MSFEAEVAVELTLAERAAERTATMESAAGGGGGAPTNASYVVLGVNATLTQERVLTGTALQVIITDNGAGSTVVLSLPQNIATSSSPTFVGLTLTGSLTLGIPVGSTSFLFRSGASGVIEGDQNLFRILADKSEIVVNENPGVQVTNWRMESDNLTHLFFLDHAADALGINQASIAASAILDIASTTKGLLPPRMTTVQRDAIGSPAAGLVLYDVTTGLLNYRNASAWVTLTTPTIDGSGAATRVAYWSDADTLTSDADFTFDGAQLALAVQGATGGVLVGGDVQWYRNAASEWRTPDSVVVDGTLYLGATKKLALTSGGSASNSLTVNSTAGAGSLLDVQVVAPTTFGSFITWSMFSGAGGGGLTATYTDGAGARTLTWTGFDTITFKADSGLAAYVLTTVAGASVFNEQGLDIDFRFEGVGAANAFFVQGSDGFVGIGTAAPAVPFQVNVSNTSTGPIEDLIQGSTGDAGLRFAIGTTTSFAVGIDNSDSDKYKISYAASGAAALGTNDVITVDGATRSTVVNGSVAGATTALYVVKAVTNSASTTLVLQVDLTHTTTVTGTYHATAVQGQLLPVIATGVTDSGVLSGLRFNAYRVSASDIGTSDGTINGLFVEVGHVSGVGAATSGTTYGLRTTEYATGSGTMTNLYGVAVLNGGSGTTTVTNSYGLYVDQVPGATLNYAIYTTQGDFRHGGTVGTTKVGFNGLTPIVAPDYTVTNPTTDRSLNVTGDTLAQGLAVLGTLIADLISYGLLR